MRSKKLKSWNDAVAESIKFGFSDESIANLISELADLVDSDISTIILYSKDAKPYWPFKSRMSEREWKSLSLRYRNGAYLLDPYYHLSEDKYEGVFCLKDNVPDEFNETEFYRVFYEAVGVVDEMCGIIQLSDDISAIVSVCRVDSQSVYETWAFDYMYSCYSILDVIVKKWWYEKQKDRFDKKVSFGPQLGCALDNFGSSLLTPRETQVARLILEGHSVKAQAEILNIGTETVKSYKKSLYQKLDIRSQSELFHVFIEALKIYDPDKSLDPLSTYL